MKELNPEKDLDGTKSDDYDQRKSDEIAALPYELRTDRPGTRRNR